MNELIIKIDWAYFLGIMGSLIAIAWYSSGRFSKSETLLDVIDRRLTNSETLLDVIDRRLTNSEISLDIIDKRLTNVEGRFSGAFQSQSPISLTAKGNSLLEDSGLKRYIDDNRNELCHGCKSKKKITNAYDVQETAFDCLNGMPFTDEFENRIKEVAFEHGVDMTVMRRVGGIYLRNLLLEELGMKEKDLDDPAGK